MPATDALIVRTPAAAAWLLCALALPPLPAIYWFATPLPYLLFAYLRAKPRWRAQAWLGWATVATLINLWLAGAVAWPTILPSLLVWSIPPAFDLQVHRGAALARAVGLWSAAALTTGLLLGVSPLVST